MGEPMRDRWLNIYCFKQYIMLLWAMIKNKQFLKLLKHLDDVLEQKETVVICGGVALALAFGSDRPTLDIDVIAPVPMSVHLKGKIARVASEMGVDSKWMNDAPKGFGGYLLSGWETRLVKVNIGLEKLDIFSIGRPDLIMMKLKAGRPKDITDVKMLNMTQEEADLILSGLDRISRFDSKVALTIKLILEEWGFVKSS